MPLTRATLCGIFTLAGVSLAGPSLSGCDRKGDKASCDAALTALDADGDGFIASDASLPKDWKERGWIEVFAQDNKSLAKVNLGPPAVGAYVKDAKGTAYLIEKDPFQRWHDLKLRLEGKGPKAPTPAPGMPPGITLPSH